jgi:hypothetical protein
MLPQAPSERLSPDQKRDLANIDPDESIESREHFVVRSHNSELSKLVADLAEHTLDRIGRFVMGEAKYPYTVEVTIYPTIAEYRKGVRQAAEWSGGSFELTRLESGFYRRALHLTQTDEQGRFDTTMLDRVLPHELCHLVVTEWFGDAPCPLYLQEGLAMLAEYGDGADRIIRAGKSIATDEGLGLQQLLTRERYEPGELEVYYAQTFSFMAYVQQRTSGDQFVAFLGHIKHGCTMDEALHRALCMIHDEQILQKVEQAWREDAIAQAQYLIALRGDRGTF